MFQNFKRNFLATAVGAFMLLLAFPMAVLANPALLSMNVDNSTIAPGQTVTFSIATNAQVNYVFAEVGANRVQATRLQADANGNQTWSLAVHPASTMNIAVFANATNDTSGAATFSMPITVTGATTPVAPVQPVPLPQPITPTPPVGQAGPIAIHSVTETPALAARQVQLTVLTGPEANEVWAQFDRGGTPGYRRGQEQTALRTESTRTFVINFQPTQWAAQQVRVGANRTYTWVGASAQDFNVTLSAPFVRPANPTIQQVTVNPRTITVGNNTTFNVRTNADVEHVWVVDIDGNRHNATRSGQATATTRNWNVSFNPGRSGSVRVYANSTDSAEGAATRNETLTVQSTTATIRNANAWWTNQNNFNNQGDVTVEVTTNYAVQRVFVDHAGRRVRLNQTSGGSGTNDRVWRGTVTGVWGNTNMTVRASLSAAYNSDASQTVNITGNPGGSGFGNAWVNVSASGNWISSHSTPTNMISGNNNVSFNITTLQSVNSMSISGGNGGTATNNGGNSWTITLFNVGWNHNNWNNHFTINATLSDGSWVSTSGSVNWN